MGHQLSLAQSNEVMKEWILLDNQSSVDLFCNPNLVKDIHESKETLFLHTNDGVIKTNMKATVPGYGVVWFDAQAMTNVFCFANMVEKYRIQYESTEENAFIVFSDKGQV